MNFPDLRKIIEGSVLVRVPFRSRGCASAAAPWSFAVLGLVRTDPMLVQTILDQEFGGAQSRVI